MKDLPEEIKGKFVKKEFKNQPIIKRQRKSSERFSKKKYQAFIIVEVSQFRFK